MSAKFKFNASVAKLQHEMWKNKLITFLNGGPAPTATSHRECSLGKWIYDEGGRDEYGSLSEMRRLEQQHTAFHDEIKKAIDAQNAGDTDAAWNAYQSTKSMSADMLSVIDVFNDRINKKS